jgi:peptide/nickel transport system permease protein
MAEQAAPALKQPAVENLIDEPAPEEQRYAYASQWRLIWWKFQSHRLALISVIALVILYLVVAFAQFLMPYDPNQRNSDAINAPPQKVHFVGKDGFRLRPFVYASKQDLNLDTLQWNYTEDTSQDYPVHFFVKVEPYRLWNVIPLDRRLFGVAEGGTLYLLGTDDLGRDMLSRMVYGGQISLSIGLVGVFMSFIIGLVIGGISGYYGGLIDNVIQRIIELLRSLPTIPLWMGLSAAVPTNWPVVRVYLMITIILSLVAWTDLARVVRGKLLSVREEDFVVAARLVGASETRIIVRHLLPSIFTYTIVSLTLAIPYMILGETALSFLGLGLQPPAISWGVLLQSAQNVRTVALYPWLLAPAIVIILTVLAFNFVGDGMRDAADPYVR